MTKTTFEQAVRDASASESAAAHYFDALAARDGSPSLSDQCSAIAERARGNAAQLKALARRLESGDLSRHAEVRIPPLPSAPSFVPNPAVTLTEALSVGCYSAYRLAFFYDVLVDAAPTHAPLFRELSRWQEELASRLDGLLRAPPDEAGTRRSVASATATGSQTL
jgi:hypothetical protein